MKEKWSKLKGWVSENKYEILGCAAIFGAAVLSSIITNKCDIYRTANGLDRLDKAGMIKFFDPDTNQELDCKNFVDMLKERYF